MEYERLYPRAGCTRAHGPSEFIKYEIRCEEKHQGQGWGGAGRNACNMRCEIYIPNRLFTVRLLKLLAYTLTSTRARGRTRGRGRGRREDGDFVHSRFKLHRYYIRKAGACARARVCFRLA